MEQVSKPPRPTVQISDRGGGYFASRSDVGDMKRYSPLLLILILLGSLAVSQAASAAVASPLAGSILTPLSGRATAPEAEEEEFEGGEEAELEIEEEELVEECEATAGEFEFENEAEEEEFEEEAEECEEETTKAGKNKAFVAAPEECTVQRAESTITTLPGTDRVRLTIHYKNYSTTPVAIGLKLKDNKGSLALERTTKHLGRNGTIHLTTKLGEPEMERAEDAREFDVALRAPGTPGYCGDLLEQHLKTTSPSSKAHGSSAHGSRVYSAPKNG
jgi:hypothetical protein